ncbi:MAG: Rrf2 family transcriptional regulator [Candidatus Gastranaerophilales bacterium]|nr:Rrf2 family transcriptional regulator [Candidatus Gastranaerophilales bacterium]
MQSIVKLSEATAIALHAVIYISRQGEKTSSVKEIAKKFQISDNHLSKVLQRLVKAGYLTSSKGPKGGFLIAEKHKDASFLEIYKVIEGDMPFTSCLFDKQPCKASSCIMGELINKINKEFIDYFTKTKISDF